MEDLHQAGPSHLLVQKKKVERQSDGLAVGYRQNGDGGSPWGLSGMAEAMLDSVEAGPS
jgi:hypothetical protein